MSEAVAWMKEREIVGENVIRDHLAAVSCGVYQGTPVLDLDYDEDSAAETDANFVMTGAGKFVEIQARPKKSPSAPTSCKA